MLMMHAMVYWWWRVAQFSFSYIAYQITKEKFSHSVVLVSKKKLFRREGSGWIGQIKHTVKVVRSTPERERGQRNDLKVWYLVHWSTQQLEESHPLLPNTLTLGKGNEEWNSSTVTRSGRHRPNTRRRNRDSSHPRHGYSRHRRSRVAENGVTPGESLVEPLFTGTEL